MEALGDLPLNVAYERLAGMVRTLGEDVQAIILGPQSHDEPPTARSRTRIQQSVLADVGAGPRQ